MIGVSLGKLRKSGSQILEGHNTLINLDVKQSLENHGCDKHIWEIIV